jgi:hypothetical protein
VPGVTPHLAQKEGRPGGSARDARTVRHPGYASSQWIRKPVAEACGWMKTIGGLRKTRSRGRARVHLHADLGAAAYHLGRIARLAPPPPESRLANRLRRPTAAASRQPTLRKHLLSLLGKL